MTIHYENYERFSRGQGYIGSMCRPAGGPAATTKRWVACDCGPCRWKLIDRRVISQAGEMGAVSSVGMEGVWIAGVPDLVSWKWFDEFWAPVPPLAEIFGQADL